MRQALAKQEQGEPVGWLDSNDKHAEFMHRDLKAEHDKRGSSTPKEFQIPVYTTPQRTWVGLTDEEKKNIFLKWYGKHWAYTSQVQNVMESVDAKLMEKNT